MKKSIRVKATDDNLSEVLELVTGVLGECDFPFKLQMLIEVCTEEIAVNVFHYAYQDDKTDNYLNVDVEVTDDKAINDKAIITFTDSGIPYNPLEHTDPDITLSADERSIGGLGIYMVKQKMDEVSYEYADGKNIFTMIKYK